MFGFFFQLAYQFSKKKKKTQVYDCILLNLFGETNF